MFRESRFKTGRLDINYMQPKSNGFNPMDLLSDAGFGFPGGKWQLTSPKHQTTFLGVMTLKGLNKFCFDFQLVTTDVIT